MNDNKNINKVLFSFIENTTHSFENDPEAAKLTIHGNKVITGRTIEGLFVETKEFEDGVNVKLWTDDNIKIQKPVILCFGVIPESGMQKINLEVTIGKNSKISINAHCIFPYAVDVQHIMNARISLKENAEYDYFEKHVHSPSGGVNVVPKAEVYLSENSRFKTEFELIEGRVGKMDIDYTVYLSDYAVAEMTARTGGFENDLIRISETAFLNGCHSRAALTTKIALKDNAKAEVFNKIVAVGEYSRGHVDCKEIVRGNAEATATPIVGVKTSTAHITHEASIGSVDKKQLETLMSRGLTEEKASDLIIQGLLAR